MISTAESVFNMPKPNNQQKCTGSSGQRAVAVVPPISQQSSNSIDQRSGILNADDGLPFKIQNTWSLTEDEYAAQQEMDIAVSVSLPHDMASDKVVHNVSTVSAPAMDIVSLPPTERTGSPFKKMAQTSDSVEPAISSTTGALDVNTSDPPDLEPQPITVTHQTEEMCGLHLNAYDSETSVEISGSGDKNGESEKNKFDLSSVPVVEWTTSKLNDLVSIIENKQKPLDLEIDIDKLIRVYGVCGYDNSDIFSSDDYISIMNDVSSVAAQDEHSVIFSQIKRKCLKKVKQNCQIIQHGDTFSDVVYKSSWLNLNEHLDDIDKEHGFPFHLRFKKRILEDYDSKELNESNCKPAEAPKEPEQMPVSPVLSQAGQQTSSDEGVRSSQDPLSSIKISVLTSEEARMFFNGEHTRDEKTEVLQSKLPELDSEEMESQMQVELPEQPFEEKENNQMKVYCCLARWISVITDHGKNIVCSCQSEVESDPEKGEASANPTDTEGTNYIDVVPFSSTVGGGCSMDVGNSFFVQKTGTADQQVKVKDMSDQCTGTENGSVVYQVQGTMHRTEEKNAEPPREQRPEMEQKNEDDLQTPPALPSGSTVVEVEIQGIYSNCKEVLKIASLMSKPLLSKGISKDECKNAPHANMDGNDHSYGAKGTGHVSLGYDEAEAKCLKFHQQGVKDLERQGFHKPLASNENHNHRDKNIRKRERKSKKCQWEIANPESKSSVCDYLPHSLKRRNKLEKPCHQVVCDIKATVEDYNDRTPLQEKREGHHRSESLKSESPELHEGKRLRNIQEGNGENGKMPRKENVFEVLPKLKEKACSVSLALYGSSPQKRNGTLRSHRELEGKPFKGRSCEERIPLPPTTISLMITPKKTDPFKNTLPGNGLAKQQVFASWKNSFVATKSSSRSKARGSTQKRIKGLGSCKYDGAAEIPGAPPTIQPNQPGPSAGQTSAHLFHRKVSPVKLRAVKKGKNKRSIPKSAVNEPFKPAAPKANKTTSAQTFYVERKPSDLTAGSLPLSKTMFLKKLKLKKKPQEMEPVHQWRQPSSVSSLPDAQTKSKCVNGNPALIPLQKEDNILEFKLLPESFSFKDGQDYKESGNPRQAKKTSSAKMSGKQSESLKKLTRKLQGSWSKSSEGKGISSEARSPSSTTRSGTTFQEYKKKYMAKDKK
ncbi:hypothetical protein AAFF_G00369450 [Aldrovandia affinis]|uniref:Uncharacterized protein n=1 Tax=Aldrovandia affinis TaxID=143900 RepID=A0AAD7SJ74_9TELE|nr:hypothetical protein AAFF_G00369450 [Aldrovandia affinis]